MNNNIKLEEENQLSTDLILPDKPVLSLLQGGKGPPGSDWLSPLPKGITFLSRNKRMANGILDQWTVWNKTEKSVLLKTEVNQEIWAWVIPRDFCLENTLHEICHDDTTEQRNND